MRTYKAQDGNEYPLEEAEYNLAFKVYRSDCKRSIIGDPHLCVIANGIRRNKDVVEVYLGSGKDAYVIFEATPARKFVHAYHFTIPASAAAVRDKFDTNEKINQQTLWLLKPTGGRTLDARAAANKKRREEIRNGSPIIERRDKPARQRIYRIGIAHRPTARISRKTVEVPQVAAE